MSADLFAITIWFMHQKEESVCNGTTLSTIEHLYRAVIVSEARQSSRKGARSAALQLVGIAGYSSSLRLALHPMEHTARTVQLPFLG